jgi:hypothetical protein
MKAAAIDMFLTVETFLSLPTASRVKDQRVKLVVEHFKGARKGVPAIILWPLRTIHPFVLNYFLDNTALQS